MKTFKVGGNRKYSSYILNLRLNLTHNMDHWCTLREDSTTLQVKGIRVKWDETSQIKRNCSSLQQQRTEASFEKKKKIYYFAEKTLVYALEKPSNAAGFPKTYESVSLSVLLSM